MNPDILCACIGVAWALVCILFLFLTRSKRPEEPRAQPLFYLTDVVVLRSGGPKMAIAGSAQGSKVWCAWFEGRKVRYRKFDQSQLLLVEDDEMFDLGE